MSASVTHSVLKPSTMGVHLSASLVNSGIHLVNVVAVVFHCHHQRCLAQDNKRLAVLS